MRMKFSHMSHLRVGVMACALDSCNLVVIQVLVEQTARAVRRMQADANRASASAPGAAESVQGVHLHSLVTS